jgi:aldehyde:ferredoxin oxidoreductase
MVTLFGYAGRLLRVDLSTGTITSLPLDDAIARKWVGGVGLGAKYLYEEVPSGVEWSDPTNRLIWTTGPLAGCGVYGAGTFNVVTKGAMTGMAGSSQANGFFGAYLKSSGFDGMIFSGVAPRLSYLLIRDGRAELRDASHLAGTDVWELETRLRQELSVREREVSIFGVGPAAEHRVRYAAIVGDRGHLASHNGVGAVMASKNLKAVVAFRGGHPVPIADPAGLKAANRELYEAAKTWGPPFQKWGTAGGFSANHAVGSLPVRNLTTNLFPNHERMNGQYLRTHYEVQHKPCYQCPVAHVVEVTVTEGPHTGFVGEEPEYECLAGWGPLIGNDELGGTVVLTREADRLGLDCNEGGWTVAWAMECYEKGVFTKEHTGGLDLTWGNVEAVKILLNRIAHREGYLGNLLAEGVMRAARTVGGEAVDWAVHTMKGVSPRGHDHRGGGRWSELFDTCMSNTSTIESTFGGVRPNLVDLPSVADPFNHEEVAAMNARFNGIRQFDDCLGICRLASPVPKLILKCLNAATGWNWELSEAMTVGRRIVNQLRVFNLRHGMRVEDERPSKRYGSIPADGPAQGRNVMEHWPQMVETYYRLMGWDPQSGRPLPATLAQLDLADLIHDL